MDDHVIGASVYIVAAIVVVGYYFWLHNRSARQVEEIEAELVRLDAEYNELKLRATNLERRTHNGSEDEASTSVRTPSR